MSFSHYIAFQGNFGTIWAAHSLSPPALVSELFWSLWRHSIASLTYNISPLFDTLNRGDGYTIYIGLYDISVSVIACTAYLSLYLSLSLVFPNLCCFPLLLNLFSLSLSFPHPPSQSILYVSLSSPHSPSQPFLYVALSFPHPPSQSILYVSLSFPHRASQPFL